MLNILQQSIEMCRSSPRSISYRRFTNEPPKTDVMEMVEIPMEVLFTEICPRINLLDFFTLICEDKCCVIDIRSNLLFEKSCIAGSINVPYSGVQLGQLTLRALGTRAYNAIQAARPGRTVVVAANEEETAQLFSDYLVKCGVQRVCILHGGISALNTHLPSLFTVPTRNGNK